MENLKVDKIEEVLLTQAAASGDWKGMLLWAVPRFMLHSAIREVNKRAPDVIDNLMAEHELQKKS